MDDPRFPLPRATPPPWAWPRVRGLLAETANAWIADRAPSLGAALAYYTLFSIAPLLLIAIAVAGAVFGVEAARGAIFQQLQGLLGADGAAAVEGLLASVQRHGQSTLGTLAGTALLLVGATSVFAELQGALDRIWQVPTPPRWPGWLRFLRTRLLSFGLVLGVGFLLMVSLVVSAALAAWGRWWAPMFGGWSVLLQAANFALDFLLTTALFAMIYKFMPSARIAWRDVLVGATCTALLFSIGKTLIGLYIGTSGVASGFGAAGSLVALLVWVYYSAQVFLFGAELTWVYARRCGSLAAGAAAPPPTGPRAADRHAVPARPPMLGASSLADIDADGDPMSKTPADTSPQTDADPALQGEGNYTAARRHRQATERFVKAGKVKPAARAAAPESADEVRDLLDAEAAGRAHARR